MTETASTKAIFVGRGGECATLHSLLRQPDQLQVYHLFGPGGMGKTRLLAWMAREVEAIDAVLQARAAPLSPDVAATAKALHDAHLHRACVTAELLDFYRTDLHRLTGLLNDIARQLGDQHFGRYRSAVAAYEQLLERQVDPAQRNEQMEAARRAFSDDLAALAETCLVVLLLDTFEAAGALGDHLLGDLLPGLGPHVLVVLVGRQRVNLPEGLKTITASLGPLSEPDVIELFRQRGLGPDLAADEQIAALVNHVGGRPVFCALAADWLTNAEGTMAELIQPEPDEDLGRTLVRRVLRLQSPEDLAILYLAQIWRLGEPELLAHLLEQPLEAVHALTHSLDRFSFIKYRAPAPGFPGSCLLHDEMRELVRTYCWPEFDRSGELRRQLLRSALTYYQGKLAPGPSGRESWRWAGGDNRDYQAEWFYYQLCLDVPAAVAGLDRLFRDAIHHRDLPFCAQLLEEMSRPEFWGQLTPAQHAEHFFRLGLVSYRSGRYDQAERHWRRVTGPNPPALQYYATALQVWSEMCSDRSQVADGLERAAKAKTVYQKLLAEQPDDLDLRRELGELYNNIGRLLRQKGDLYGAIDNYERALDIYKRLPEASVRKGRARTLNNMGYVRKELGDLEGAKTQCGIGLQLRKQLDPPIKYELALSYNTMGMVLEEDGNYEEASRCVERALALFAEEQHRYGRGLALIPRGRMLRRTCDFETALKTLEEARGIFASKDGSRESLAQVLNELGCVYREREQPGDAQQSDESFRQALELARQFSPTLQINVLVDWLVLHARRGDRQAAVAAAADIQQLIDGHDLQHYRSTLLWAMAILAWQEAEELEGHGRLPEARELFGSAFDTLVDAAAAAIRSSEHGQQGRRGLPRYRRTIDEIQRHLHARPADEIPELVQRLQDRWRLTGLADDHAELADILRESLEAIAYLELKPVSP